MKPDATDLKLYELLYDGEKKRAELLIAFANRRSALNRKLEKALKHNLVRPSRHGVYELTEKGRKIVAASLTSATPPDLENPRIKELVSLFPTEEHRALFRIVFSLVVGKMILLQYFERGWPSIIAFGNSQKLKTTTAEALCYLFGFDIDTHIYYVPELAPKEVTIRHMRGKEGYKAVVADSFEKPLVVFDECDKTQDKEVKRSILSFLNDRRSFLSEGEKIVKKSTAYLTFNQKGGLANLIDFGISEPLIRRSVILDVTPLTFDPEDPSMIAGRILDFVKAKGAPRIELSGLKPRVTELNEEQRTLINDWLSPVIKDEHRNLTDLHSLTILSLCRLHVLPDGTSVEEAIERALYDYFLCMNTLGITTPNWEEYFNNPEQNPPSITNAPQTSLQSVTTSPKTVPKTAAGPETATVTAENLEFRADKRQLAHEIETLCQDLPKNRNTDTIIGNMKDLLKTIEQAPDETALEKLAGYYREKLKPVADGILAEETLRKAKETKRQEIASEWEKLSELVNRATLLNGVDVIRGLLCLRCGEYEGLWSFKSLDQGWHVFSKDPDKDNKTEAVNVVNVRIALLDTIGKVLNGETDVRLVSLPLADMEKQAVEVIQRQQNTPIHVKMNWNADTLSEAVKEMFKEMKR